MAHKTWKDYIIGCIELCTAWFALLPLPPPLSRSYAAESLVAISVASQQPPGGALKQSGRFRDTQWAWTLSTELSGPVTINLLPGAAMVERAAVLKGLRSELSRSAQ